MKNAEISLRPPQRWAFVFRGAVRSEFADESAVRLKQTSLGAFEGGANAIGA